VIKGPFHPKHDCRVQHFCYLSLCHTRTLYRNCNSVCNRRLKPTHLSATASVVIQFASNRQRHRNTHRARLSDCACAVLDCNAVNIRSSAGDVEATTARRSVSMAARSAAERRRAHRCDDAPLPQSVYVACMPADCRRIGDNLESTALATYRTRRSIAE